MAKIYESIRRAGEDPRKRDPYYLKLESAYSYASDICDALYLFMSAYKDAYDNMYDSTGNGFGYKDDDFILELKNVLSRYDAHTPCVFCDNPLDQERILGLATDAAGVLINSLDDDDDWYYNGKLRDVDKYSWFKVIAEMISVAAFAHSIRESDSVKDADNGISFSQYTMKTKEKDIYVSRRYIFQCIEDGIDLIDDMMDIIREIHDACAEYASGMKDMDTFALNDAYLSCFWHELNILILIAGKEDASDSAIIKYTALGNAITNARISGLSKPKKGSNPDILLSKEVYPYPMLSRLLIKEYVKEEIKKNADPKYHVDSLEDVGISPDDLDEEEREDLLNMIAIANDADAGDTRALFHSTLQKLGLENPKENEPKDEDNINSESMKDSDKSIADKTAKSVSDDRDVICVEKLGEILSSINRIDTVLSSCADDITYQSDDASHLTNHDFLRILHLLVTANFAGNYNTDDSCYGATAEEYLFMIRMTDDWRESMPQYDGELWDIEYPNAKFSKLINCYIINHLKDFMKSVFPEG